jgi:glutaminyl-peptide cyclotransferase
VEFGPRVPETKAHEKCAAYLESKLKFYGLTVHVQQGVVVNYEGKKYHIKNIMGSFSPDVKTRILLCSHWDSRSIADQDSVRKNEPIDGADDGASGVGVLLELARELQKSAPTVGVDVLFLDAEDTGQPNDTEPEKHKEDAWCLGTQYWAQNLPAGYMPRFGILLDMVGAKNATFPMEGHSMAFAGDIVNKVWGIASDLGFSNYFIYAKGGMITDDHYYINRNAKIPTIDILNYNPHGSEFGYYHHRHSDNMEIIDRNTLKAVGQTLVQLIYTESL